MIIVLYCKNGHDPLAITTTTGPVACEKCGNDMQEIGWFEENGKERQED